MAPRNRKWLGVAVAAVVLVLVAIGVVVFWGAEAVGADPNIPTFAVARGPLTIGIDVSGTLKAQDMIVIKNDVEGRTTIISLVEEGKAVKKGDLLVELDSSSLQDQLVNQEIAVRSAETAYVSAQENLAVGENQAQADIDLAELTLRFARQDLEKYIAEEGEYETQLTDAQSQIAVKEEAAQQAKDKYEWSRRLYEEKYISETELKADELAWRRAEMDVTLAKNNLKLLQDWTYKRQLAQLESDVKQAEMALERTKRKARADVILLKAELLAAEERLERQKTLLAKIQQNIKNTKIYAPADGIVVYATSNRGGGWRGNQEPLDVGQEVYERQELIHLPTSKKVKAEVKIHESSLDKVREGLPAIITVDSVKNRTFTGRVTKIALLPDATMAWLNPDLKVYNTEVELDGNGDDLRTGMSCRARVIIEEYDDVLYVPVQAVVRKGNQPVVYVLEGREMKMRPVEIGLDNNRMVHIVSGLSEGEKVVLNPPLEHTEARQQRRPDVPEEQVFPGSEQETERQSPPNLGPGGSAEPERQGQPPRIPGTDGTQGRPEGFQPGQRPPRQPGSGGPSGQRQRPERGGEGTAPPARRSATGDTTTPATREGAGTQNPPRNP
ncbi:MAG TPA: efflux RND transporter periplasmic adaptor subunit [Phycisphaerales bacterium]|nr:efflux RND transporter periplasmic adaptor subunit [Phycisphaerales bacterium]